MALTIFAIALVYLVVFVQGPGPHGLPATSLEARGTDGDTVGTAPARTDGPFRSLMGNLFSPLELFRAQLRFAVLGLALLVYNTGQAFAFSAIMVYTTLSLNFSSKQNGLLISIAHAVSAVYVLFILFAVPHVRSKFKRQPAESHESMSAPEAWPMDAASGVFSLVTQSCALSILTTATKAWQVYPTIALYSLGLAAPSFIKSYAVQQFDVHDAPRAIAAISMMETTGGFLAPLFLGGIQVTWPGRVVLLAASATIGTSAMLLGVGIMMEKTRDREVSVE
ncbi:MAG: hypothetical protein L6R38_004834 [Xanthoria sp. 2 TBL-2021]|nr:MAG: hypothetical protein L6R38_004834 [Xanthoria sp. 2 TBL-2021]